MKSRKTLLVIVTTLIIACVSLAIAYHETNSATLPKELETCPKLPAEADYAFGILDERNSTVLFFADDTYKWVVKVLSTGELGWTLSVGGSPNAGYWVWGTGSNETHDRWWHIPEKALLYKPIIIYNKSCAPIWDRWSEPNVSAVAQNISSEDLKKWGM